MFRHLPRKYTKREVVAALEQHVARSAFDLVHVPWDSMSASNMGFAFANFVDAESATRILARMQGSLWPNDPRLRPMKIVLSHVQGFAACLRKCMDASKTSDYIGPLILSRGNEVPLHLALQQIHDGRGWDAQDNIQASILGTAHQAHQSRIAQDAQDNIQANMLGTSRQAHQSRIPQDPVVETLAGSSQDPLSTTSPGPALQHLRTVAASPQAEFTSPDTSNLVCQGCHPASARLAASGGVAPSARQFASLDDEGVRRSAAYIEASLEVTRLLQRLRQKGFF